MPILNSKKIKELTTENEELKAFIQNLTEKETHYKQLDEHLRKARVDFANIKIKKEQTASTLEHLEIEKSKLNNHIQKLSSEIRQLREMKFDEQKNVNALNNIPYEIGTALKNGDVNDEQAIKLRIQKETELAEKRKAELEKETVEMEKRFREIYTRVLEVGEMDQTLKTDIKKKKDEIQKLDTVRDQFSHEQMKNFNNRIAALKDEEKKNLLEIKQRIKQLSDREIELQKRVDLREKTLKEIEENADQKNTNEVKVTEEKLPALIAEEQKLLDSIEFKKRVFSELEQSIRSLKEEKNKITDELNRTAELLQNEKILPKVGLDYPEINATELTEIEKEAITTNGVIKALKEEERIIRESIEKLVQAESLKKELISDLNDNLSAKEIQFAELIKEHDSKSGRLNEISVRNKLILEELATKTNELSSVENSFNTKITRLNELTGEVDSLEAKLLVLKNEVTEKDSLKSELDEKIKTEKDAWIKLEEYYKQLTETVPMLEQRKEEMGFSNNLFEKRFADMFRHYSTQMGEMYKKKNLLEQMIIKKELDVNEKDQTLSEKLSALDETEKVLTIRKTEAESIEELLKTINDQRELIAGDISALEEKNLEKRIQNTELRIESDLFRKKLIEFESGLRELFKRAEERFARNSEMKSGIESELRQYDSRLNELTKAIKDSMNELVDLRTTISRIKVEHEEHRIGINKLAEVKKKLEEEINKHRVVIDKYTRIKEKIRQEQDLIRRKREIISLKETSNNPAETEKSFEPHHLNWIKLK